MNHILFVNHGGILRDLLYDGESAVIPYEITEEDSLTHSLVVLKTRFPAMILIDEGADPDELQHYISTIKEHVDVPVLVLARKLVVRKAANIGGADYVYSTRGLAVNIRKKIVSAIDAEMSQMTTSTPEPKPAPTWTTEALLEAYANGERDFSGANLTGLNLAQANLTGADFSGAQLSETDLSGAILKSCNLSGADLCRAQLSFADLHSANLTEADLTSANMSAAILIRTRFRNTTLPDGTIR
jgi:glutaredoxin